ncbi:MAG: hypothetical protein JNM17_28550 [Archangium sp.]|nr:hypothetical protein [Archangium sp.]
MIVLRELQTVMGEWPDSELLVALDAYWKNAIGYSWERNRASNWKLSIPGRGDFCLDPDDRTLRALQQRMSEHGFREQAVRIHAGMLATFELEKILSIPARLDSIDHIVELIREAMDLTDPLRHVGEVECALARPPGATFTVATLHGAYANGAGTMTDYDQWVLDLYEPSRVSVSIERTSEYINESWTLKVRHDPGTVIAPLMDAFHQHGLHASAVVTRLAS